MSITRNNEKRLEQVRKAILKKAMNTLGFKDGKNDFDPNVFFESSQDSNPVVIHVGYETNSWRGKGYVSVSYCKKHGYVQTTRKAKFCFNMNSCFSKAKIEELWKRMLPKIAELITMQKDENRAYAALDKEEKQYKKVANQLLLTLGLKDEDVITHNAQTTFISCGECIECFIGKDKIEDISLNRVRLTAKQVEEISALAEPTFRADIRISEMSIPKFKKFIRIIRDTV